MTKSALELPHLLDREALTVRAIIETPAGSNAKFTFDPETGLYTISKLLPIGLAMPLDFGFIPSTWSGDNDPLDIMLLSEAELPTGSMVTARLLGAIEVEQTDRNSDKKPERNDRLIARLDESRRWVHIDRLEQLGRGFVTELNYFFETYKEQRCQTYKVLAVSGPERAAELVVKWSGSPATIENVTA
jgi:inorganic pyrophosphatase